MNNLSFYTGILSGIVILVVYVFYYFITEQQFFKNNRKLTIVLDILAGLGLPFLGVPIILALESYAAEAWQITSTFNSTSSYGALILVSLIFGSFMLLRKRKLLGSVIVATVLLSTTIIVFMLVGIGNAH
jgi:hypothetical protein